MKDVTLHHIIKYLHLLKTMMVYKKMMTLLFCAFGFLSPNLNAQNSLSLDSCRKMALTNNKTLSISKTKIQKAHFNKKAAGTNYLPKISVMAGYIRTNKELSILNDRQKNTLTNLGNSFTGAFGDIAGQIIQQHPDLAPLIQAAGSYAPQIGGALNGIGQDVVNAFRTDNRNMTTGAVILTQPLYMGGKIRAYNKITHYAEAIAGEQLKADEQQIILDVDQAYWQVVSLTNKKKLAENYRDMLRSIDNDILKMINEGVATKANELTVSVKLNEAEMTLTKVEDGLSLSRMLLCQICGLPMDTPIRLNDEYLENLQVENTAVSVDTTTAYQNRPEIQQLQSAVDLYKEKVKIERAAYLPQLALTGGYLTTYPGLTNGFEKKFRGMWNVGVTMSIPVWNWGESRYKIKSAKADALIAGYQMDDAREKITLQLHQAAFRVNEAGKKLSMSVKNLEKAEENLRVAKIGFNEGVINTSDLLAAQTAWLQANSEKIDAQIDMKMSHLLFNKAQGTLPTPQPQN